ncbi:TetR family transcriptional regulator [Halopolyspora algeriensis]|uniref:TetR family transcriptional regulator n=1 Tax=Halopolyspora algeriensis TaxID=1500506 RepID=A0A368VF67_9ACTN|nr:TetR/AcrR family transcriptional regulator [Halopolyspora algeriensis]RCW39788.1 TetR family transcriptional regulator [Halopolyspora algeriensis]TQM56443.1 TetR family transcriptional regulator [Halopolyspora algeriensis]
MPKRVDHEERRQKIAEAVWRIAADRGLEAASLREVAAEAGVSMGRIQHYFASKDRMILFACEHMVELAEQGARELATAADGTETPRSVLRGVFAQTLPLDEQQRVGTGVWLAFLNRATGDHELAAFIRRAWTGTRDLVVEQLRRAQDNGEISAEVAPEQEATALVALADGLVSHLMVGHYTVEEALAAVDGQLDRLFG